MSKQAADAVESVARNPLMVPQEGPWKDLASDLRAAESGRLTHWYDIDPSTLFLPELLSAPESWRSRTGHYLALLAGFGIFIPLIITWWEVRKASEAYTQLLSTGGLSPGASFFSLWMEGFGGLALPFGRVALATTTALMIVALTYTAARWFQASGEAQAGAVERVFGAQVTEAATLAQRAIAEARYGDESSAYAQVVATAEAARESSELARLLLEDVRRVAEKSQDLFDQHVGLMDAGARRLEEATAGMREALQHVEAAQVDLARESQNAIADHAGVMQASAQQVGEAVERVRLAMDAIRATAQAMQRDGQQRDADLAAAHDRLVQSLSDVDAAARQRQQLALEELRDHAARLGEQIVASHQSFAQSAAGSLAHVQAALAKTTGGVTQSLGQALSDLSSAVRQLTQSVESGMADSRDAYVLAAGAGQDQAELLQELVSSLRPLGDPSPNGGSG